jgi:hypothetical protein
LVREFKIIIYCEHNLSLPLCLHRREVSVLSLLLDGEKMRARLAKILEQTRESEEREREIHVDNRQVRLPQTGSIK